MQPPHARGRVSTAVLTALTTGTPIRDPGLDTSSPVLENEDVQIALWMLYELHYRGFDGVAEAAEWDPDLIRVRVQLERLLERDLRALAGTLPGPGRTITEALEQLLSDADGFGPSLARFIHREATAAQFREFLTHRSIYHLKESDPHAWALPRVTGPAKVALAEILYDEFGAGRPERLHSTLFARTLEGAGLDSEDGAYLDLVPAYTLAVNNAMSFFGLHRRLRGAILGHLAAFEATSSLPNRRHSQGASRLGFGADVTDYFEEHVEADAAHEQIALRDICENLVHDEPALREDVLLGASVCLRLDALAAARMIDTWRTGASTLRTRPGSEVA